MPSAHRKIVLTDKTLQALKPAAAGKRLNIWDAQTPNFGVRVSDNNTLGIKGRDLQRQRVLADQEMRDIWAVAEEIG